MYLSSNIYLYMYTEDGAVEYFLKKIEKKDKDPIAEVYTIGN